MANDYSKPAPAGRNGGRPDRPMNAMFLGIIIGLLLGIVIALGVALWLNKSAIPFMEKSKPLEPPPKLESKAQAKVEPPKIEPRTEPAKAPESVPPKTSPEKSRFEFYQILPGDKDAGKVAKPAAKKPVDAQPAEKPAAVAKEAYFLQAGAFQSETDADNMKAKIAFIGLAASVKPVTLADKGTLYRVRLGPYQSLEEVNRIKSALSDNGVGAAVVKASDTIN
jgi:cell division protein FtsN